MQERIIIIACGFALDLIFGDPLWLWHPVMGIGKVISCSDRVLRKLFGIREEREKDREKKRVAGVLLVLVTLFFSLLIPALILYGAGLIHPWLKTGISCVMCYQLLALKSLRTESMKVYAALQQENIEPARKAVSMIVGRDTQCLDREGVTKAAVETIAENTSDGVIAPLLYMLLFGVLGGFFYKAVNTMDSMVGYKNDRWRYMGTAAAKLDDIVNFIPARIAAAAMIGAAFFLGLDYKNAARIYKRDRRQHASPNSAQTEAVCAGALGVQLAGDAYYFGQLCHKPTIGDHGRSVEAEDIKRANRLLYAASLLVLAAGLLGLAVC